MNQISSWADYFTWNKPNIKLRWLWNEKLFSAILNGTIITDLKSKSILDYGCGHFDLGLSLHPYVLKVDGFDPHFLNLNEAKNTLIKMGSETELFSKIEEIPAIRYDLIVLNSVVQYFNGQSEIEIFLKNSLRWLKFKQGKILITDLIPKNYNANLAVLNSFYFTLKTGVLMPWLRHMRKAATKPKHLELYKIDLDELTAVAKKAGFEVKKLRENLTPGHQRYSVVLSPRS